jgi:hypothetical protein
MRKKIVSMYTKMLRQLDKSVKAMSGHCGGGGSGHCS